MNNTKYDYKLVGIDTETGGLNGYFRCPNTGTTLKGSEHYPILEIALVVPKIVPKMGLNDCGVMLEVGEGDSFTIGIKPYVDPDAYLDLDDWAKDNLSAWAYKQHKKSGLLDRLEKSEGFDFIATSYEHAQKVILRWLDHKGVEAYDRETRTGAIVYGNNINFDLDFIGAKMPELTNHFHYRKIDVSAINVLARSVWYDFSIDTPSKQLNHTALADILESTEELNLYTNWLDDFGNQGEDNA